MAITEVMDSIRRQSQIARSSGSNGCLLLVLALLFSMNAEAELDAGISIGISRTDNVFLSPPGQEFDDRFTQVSPFLNWAKETPTYDGLFNYRYDRFDYDDFSLDQSWHFLDARLAGKALEEALRFEVGASRRQVLQLPEQDILPGQAPISGNLTDLDQWYVEPSFNQRLGGSSTLLLRYRYTDSRYDNLGVDSSQIALDNETQDAQFSLDNYESGQGLTWALRYDFVRTDYDNELFLPFEYQKAGAELGFWAGSGMRVFAGGGQESKWDDPFDRSPQDPYWEAGFAYQSGDKINAEIAAGERSFGESLRASLSYDFRRGNTTVRYLEQPTTEGFNFRRGGNPINPQDPDDFLTNPGRAERFISNRFDWSLTLEGRRTQFLVSVLAEERTARTAADGTLLEDQGQRSLNARFSWNAGTRTEFVLDGSFINRDFADDVEDELVRGIVAINYRLGSRTTLSLAHQHIDQAPGETGAARAFTADTTSLFVTFALRND